MQIAGGGEPEAALQRGAEVGDDVAEQVVGHDHVELRRRLHHQERERVDVEVPCLDAGVLRRDLAEDALPQRVPLRHRVALVGHAHAAAACGLRELERVADDPVDALVGVELLLDRDLVVGARLEAAADADVQPLGVLAEDDEVDVRRRAILQRAQPRVEQPHRAVIDVEIELEPRAEQDVARVTVVGHTRIAERADEDRVELPQRRVAVGRHRDAGAQVMIGAPRQRLELDRAAEDVRCPPKHLHRLGGRFDADAVARNNRYTHVMRSRDR